jgi:hypothetical protein
VAKVDVRVAGKTVFSGEVEAPSFKVENGVVSGGGAVVEKKEGV